MNKVAIIHFAYYPNIGGVEKLIQDHAHILASLGYGVKVLTGDGAEQAENIEVVNIDELKSVLSFAPELQAKILDQGKIDEDFYKLSDLIYSKIEKSLADCQTVIVHNMMTVYRNLPFTFAFKKYIAAHPEKKIIVWVHDHMYIKNDRIIRAEKKTSDVEEELITTPIANVNYVVISETFRKSLVKVLPIEEKNSRVIPNGINIKSFLEIDDSIWKISRDLGLLTRFPLILAPVNLLERKNIEYSLEIVAALKKNYPEIGFIISGQTSKHRNTQEYSEKIDGLIRNLGIEDNVFFISKIISRSLLNSEIRDLYNLADLIFYFSASENFGIPILEAGATRTPIFTSDIEIFKEIGKSNINIVDPKTPAGETASTIDGFIKSSQNVRLFRDVKENYDLEVIIKNNLVPIL